VLSHNHEGKYSKNARYTYQHSRDPEISHNIRDSRCGRRRNEQAGILLAKRTITRELQKPTDNSTLLYEHNDLRRDQCESLSQSCGTLLPSWKLQLSEGATTHLNSRYQRNKYLCCHPGSALSSQWAGRNYDKESSSGSEAVSTAPRSQGPLYTKPRSLTASQNFSATPLSRSTRESRVMTDHAFATRSHRLILDINRQYQVRG